MSQEKSGSRTLLMSVLMSSPGPIVVGLGLLAGKSATQIADFIRRTTELLAIILSFVVYQMTTKDGVCNEEKKGKLEKFSNVFVGVTMCVCGVIMIGLALGSNNQEKGNVIPGLAIAILGVIANTLFWIKYSKLNKAEPNPILAVQARLYGAKSLVDGCVTIALASVALFPYSSVSYYLDLIGSIFVAIYLLWCGTKTLWEKIRECRV